MALSGVEVKEEDTETDTKTTPMKVLPPWMIKQGMNLTKEQRGEVKPVPKIDQSSEPVDDKKPKDIKEDDEKNIQASRKTSTIFIGAFTYIFLQILVLAHVPI